MKVWPAVGDCGTVNTDNWQMRILTTVPESRLPLLTTLNHIDGSMRRINKLIELSLSKKLEKYKVRN